MERSARTNIILVAIALMVFGAGFFAWAHAQMVGVTLPTVPGSVSATAGTAPGQIDVGWAAATESSGTIEGYYVYRNGTQIATTADTSFVDAGLPSGQYNYTVVAYDANAYQSPQSSVATVTLVADTTPPSAPSNVTVTGVTSTNSTYIQIPITVSWGASTDNVGVVGYYAYRNGMPITSGAAPLTGTSIADMVTPGTYTYTVVAYDAAQNISARSTPVTITIAVDTIPPSTPTKVVAQQVAANTVSVAWVTSTDPVGVAGYQIFRNGIQVASAGGPPYSDSGLATNYEYSYSIAAYDTAGNISLGSQPLATVVVQPFNGPSAPVIIGESLTGTSSAFVSWASGADPLTIVNYELYRDGSQIASVTSTNYIDTGLAPGLHEYTMTETDVSGAVSAMSATSTLIVPSATNGTPPLTPTPPVATTTTTTQSSAPTTTPVMAAASSSAITPVITQFLYYGLHGAQVTTLQNLLAGNGYLSSMNATGFFGTLTLTAIEKFQCDNGIVCTGGAGWGTVGPKTRAVLNALSPLSSLSSMLAELKALEAELATLQAQGAK